MSESYRPHTLGMLLEWLATLPAEAVIVGLETGVISYRGYYDRNCIQPDPTMIVYAHDLHESLRSYVGSTIHGYKGGEYIVSEDEYVYVAPYGLTGPSLIGFKEVAPLRFEPILLEESWGL